MLGSVFTDYEYQQQQQLQLQNQQHTNRSQYNVQVNVRYTPITNYTIYPNDIYSGNTAYQQLYCNNNNCLPLATYPSQQQNQSNINSYIQSSSTNYTKCVLSIQIVSDYNA